MSNESEKNPARRVEDKRADGAVDWSDAPRFTALGIAETWSVSVEAEGRRVVSISERHCASLDESDLAQFHATVRSCAMHLLAFVGAPPMSRTAGAAKGGITSLEGLTRYSDAQIASAPCTHRTFFDAADVERLLSSPAAGEEQTGDLPPLPEYLGISEVEKERAHAYAINYARAAIAAHLARQAQAEPIPDILFDGKAVYDEITRQLGRAHCFTADAVSTTLDAVVRLLRRAAPVAPAGAQTTKHTDLAQRLRTIASAVKPNDPALVTPKCLIDAADEIDRYYSGMLAWKQTAEKKDRDWNNERMARVNERCEARAGAQNAEAIRNQAYAKCIEIAESELSNTNALASMPPQSAAAFSIINRIHFLQTGSANTQEGSDHA